MVCLSSTVRAYIVGEDIPMDFALIHAQTWPTSIGWLPQIQSLAEAFSGCKFCCSFDLLSYQEVYSSLPKLTWFVKICAYQSCFTFSPSRASVYTTISKYVKVKVTSFCTLAGTSMKAETQKEGPYPFSPHLCSHFQPTGYALYCKHKRCYKQHGSHLT